MRGVRIHRDHRNARVHGGIDLRLEHGSIRHGDQNASRLGRDRILQLGQFGLGIVALGTNNPGRYLVLFSCFVKPGRYCLPVGQVSVCRYQIENLFG